MPAHAISGVSATSCGVIRAIYRQHFGRRSAGGRGGTPSQVLQRVRWCNLLHHTHKLGNFSLLGAGMAYLQRVPFRNSDICPFTGVRQFAGFSFLWCRKIRRFSFLWSPKMRFSLFLVCKNSFFGVRQFAGFSFLWCCKVLFFAFYGLSKLQNS